MKRAALALLFACAAMHAAHKPRQYTIEQFLNTTRIAGASFSSDEKSILVSSNKSGIFNVYAIPVAGGEPRQLTTLKESTFAVSYFPRDDRILYTHDVGGNENNHLYVRTSDGAERDLTPGEKVKASFMRWSKDEKWFYATTNERDPKFFDLYRYATEGYDRNLVYEDKAGYQISSVSDDGRYLALEKPNTTSDSDIYLYDITRKDLKHITPHKGDASYDADQFDPSSRYLYYRTNDGGEFAYAARYELATGKVEPVERANWDVIFTHFSRNGKYRVSGTNEDGMIRVRVYDASTGKQVTIPNLPDGQIFGMNIARSENLMTLYLNSDRSPNNLYVYDFRNRNLKKLTESLNPEIDPEDLVESRLVRYPSFDKLAIPGILYKPHQADMDHKAPALIMVHGGPGGQSLKSYSPLIQFLVNHGYVIFNVNNRGSSGYGKTFFKADDRKHGHEPLWDCVEAKNYVAKQSYVLPDRIGIIGGSYGGYMTLAALTLKPEEFAVGVDLFGISNWVRTLESIPPYWESFKHALYTEIGDPKTDREMLLEVSPLFHADRIVRPLMVLQGANDPRVIKPESDEIVEAVRKRGGVVEYVLFPDEGHGFTKRANEITGYGAILKFLDKYLKPSLPA
jgi:dipeptidyl aminopeptidase/acylaminoacyl peptidase